MWVSQLTEGKWLDQSDASVPQFKTRKIAGWEGWLAPAQVKGDSIRMVVHLERGQATLPNLQFALH